MLYKMSLDQVKLLNQKVVQLHDALEQDVGSIYDVIIDELSNSRRTTFKRLNNWKLIDVSPIDHDKGECNDGECDSVSFYVKLESPKGIHRGLPSNYIVQFIKK